METNKTMVLLGVLVVGVFAGYLWGEARTSYPQSNMHMMSNGMMMRNADMGMGSAMDDMMRGLEGLNGDSFDRAFLSEMIVHHQGAVVMAEAALRNARHSELKAMAQEIISAQTAEIDQMKAWQRAWYSQ